MQTDSGSKIMTIDEVAAYLRVSERTVYDWAQKGEIPCGKLGTSWRFKRSEIENWVNRKLGVSRYPEVPPLVSISSVLTEKRCRIVSHATKMEVLKEMVEVLSTAPQVTDSRDLERAIFRREQLMSTGIGLGIGLPHARLHSVTNVVMALGVVPVPIADYESLDGQPVGIIVMLAAGDAQHAQHIRLLSQVSARLKDAEVREALIGARDPAAMYSIMTQGRVMDA